jgi:hypothetical protein
MSYIIGLQDLNKVFAVDYTFIFLYIIMPIIIFVAFFRSFKYKFPLLLKRSAISVIVPLIIVLLVAEGTWSTVSGSGYYFQNSTVYVVYDKEINSFDKRDIASMRVVKVSDIFNEKEGVPHLKWRVNAIYTGSISAGKFKLDTVPRAQVFFLPAV